MTKRYLWLSAVISFALIILSCAPGNDRWDQDLNPGHLAGFWAGIWHGLIIIITFIVSLFAKEVGIYEVNNSGWTYNLGFLIGLCFSILAPWKKGIWRWGRRKKVEVEWKEIGDKIGERVRSGIKDWLEKTEREDREKEWEEIADRIEEKIRKVLKEWTDK